MLRIKRIQIENYRSIKRLEIEPPLLCALVGPNNAGKSNILTALDLLLGPRYPTEASLSADDYYRRDQTLPPLIAADFEYHDEASFTQTMRIEFGPDPYAGGDLKLRYWGEGVQGRCGIVVNVLIVVYLASALRRRLAAGRR